MAGAARRPRAPVVIVLSAHSCLLVVAPGLGDAIGAAGIPLSRLCAASGLGTGDAGLIARDQLVLWSIRLPRIAVAGMVGALLAAAGAIMQGLFRNPLADPALVGVSSGAAFAAAATIVVADKFLVRADRRDSIRGAAGRRVRRRAGHDAGALPDRHPPEPHIGCDLPPRRARHRRHCQRRDRAADLSVRRPAIARHHLLDAGLARRRDLGARPERSCRSWSRSCWASPLIARGLDLLVLGRGRSVPHGRRRRAPEADFHRADRCCNRRGRVGVGSDRLRRHRGAACAAACDRSIPSIAAAIVDAARAPP